MMVKPQIYATLYVFDKDGNQEKEMPCFTKEQAELHASRYPKVRVVRDGTPPFWLYLKPEWVEEFNKTHTIYAPDDIVLEWLRGSAVEGNGTDSPEVMCAPAKMSDEFYDGWKKQSKKRP